MTTPATREARRRYEELAERASQVALELVELRERYARLRAAAVAVKERGDDAAWDELVAALAEPPGGAEGA